MWVRRKHLLCGLEEALTVWVRGSTYCVGERKHLLCGLEEAITVWVRGCTSCVG